jgi:predicted metal-dependent phosphoesterase TrpH
VPPLPACDFHTHTLHSDGELAPAALLALAAKKKITVLALTDHDSTEGLAEARREADARGITFIDGIELSATPRSEASEDMHILGFFIDPQSAALQSALKEMRRQRFERIRLMVQKLKEIGAPVDDSFLKAADGQSLGRPHVAQALIKARHVDSAGEAFERFLKAGRAGYVPRRGPGPAECIALIHGAGGVAVVAHPEFGGPRGEEEWKNLVDAGIDGIEAYHSQHTRVKSQELAAFARRFGLITSGGSDFHSENGPAGARLGSVRLPIEFLDNLIARKKRNKDPLTHPLPQAGEGQKI